MLIILRTKNSVTSKMRFDRPKKGSDRLNNILCKMPEIGS